VTRSQIVLGALVVGAFVAGVVYSSHDSSEEAATPTQSASGKMADAGHATSAVTTRDSARIAASASQAGIQAPKTAAPLPDPRLDALKVSQDNGLIEFVRAGDGKVISEIDKDPASPSFRKPLREYLYAGDKVVGLTTYRYLSDHVEIGKTVVSYRPDGSVDRFVESMRLN
jgi:hypothetical protein